MRAPRALVRRGAGVLAALALLSCGDGSDGPEGTAGLMGGAGLRGATGPRGPQGMQGAQGAQGAQGGRGMQGLVNFRYAQTTEALSLSGTFPWNDQAPQINQGSQLLSVSITPQSDASVLVFDGVVHWTEGNVNSSDYFTVALFQEGVTAALASAADAPSNGNGRCTADGTYTQICSLGFHFIVPSPGNAATIYHLRVGLNGGAVRINSSFNGRQLGGRLASTMSVMEIAR